MPRKGCAVGWSGRIETCPHQEGQATRASSLPGSPARHPHVSPRHSKREPAPGGQGMDQGGQRGEHAIGVAPGKEGTAEQHRVAVSGAREGVIGVRSHLGFPRSRGRNCQHIIKRVITKIVMLLCGDTANVLRGSTVNEGTRGTATAKNAREGS